MHKVNIDTRSMFNNPLDRVQVDFIGSQTVAIFNGHIEKVIPHEGQMSISLPGAQDGSSKRKIKHAGS